MINFWRLSSPGFVSSCICGSISGLQAAMKRKTTPASKVCMNEKRVLGEVFIVEIY
jgi:hypothetical protein